MTWETMFLCPECGRLSNRVILYETQIWSYWYYVDIGEDEDEQFEETTDRIYRCPDCGADVDPDYYLIEVDEENEVFRIPDDSYWAEDVEAAKMLMVNRYGYRLLDDEWDEDTEEDIDDIEGKDIFVSQENIWEV